MQKVTFLTKIKDPVERALRACGGYFPDKALDTVYFKGVLKADPAFALQTIKRIMGPIFEQHQIWRWRSDLEWLEKQCKGVHAMVDDAMKEDCATKMLERYQITYASLLRSHRSYASSLSKDKNKQRELINDRGKLVYPLLVYDKKSTAFYGSPIANRHKDLRDRMKDLSGTVVDNGEVLRALLTDLLVLMDELQALYEGIPGARQEWVDGRNTLRHSLQRTWEIKAPAVSASTTSTKFETTIPGDLQSDGKLSANQLRKLRKRTRQQGVPADEPTTRGRIGSRGPLPGSSKASTPSPGPSAPPSGLSSRAHSRAASATGSPRLARPASIASRSSGSSSQSPARSAGSVKAASRSPSPVRTSLSVFVQVFPSEFATSLPRSHQSTARQKIEAMRQQVTTKPNAGQVQHILKLASDLLEEGLKTAMPTSAAVSNQDEIEYRKIQTQAEYLKNDRTAFSKLRRFVYDKSPVNGASQVGLAIRNKKNLDASFPKMLVQAQALVKGLEVLSQSVYEPEQHMLRLISAEQWAIWKTVALMAQSLK